MPSKIFIPPVQMLIVAALMWGLQAYLPLARFAGGWQWPLALGLAASGILLILICGVAFLRARTTVHPTHPQQTSTLVVGGLYRLSRNPMYLGLLLILFAWGVYLGSLPALLAAPLFVLSINRSQIVHEERALAEKFGDQYRAYAQRVRRWI